MPEVEFYTAADPTTGDWIRAAAAIAIAFLVAQLVDYVITHRGRKVTDAVVGGELSPVAVTRLRLVRRLISALIILIGLAIALSFFDPVRQIATAVLASSAVLGLVVGFAARQTLANAIAGIQLAITQPIRIGDRVTFEEKSGVVEDVRLSYTYIQLDQGQRLIVPNERLAQSPVENHSINDPRVTAEASVWLSPDVDLDRAIELIEDAEAGISAGVAEVDREGVRLAASVWVASPAERAEEAEALRRRWLRQLRRHGLSSVEAS